MLWASLVIDNIGALACFDGGGPHGLGIILDAAVVIDADRIVWLGPRAQLPVDVRGVPRLDAGGRCVMPGLIDCHTHLMFLGSRADEFARRARGETYAQIMAAGGGIRSTMRAVRAATVDTLAQATLPRLRAQLLRGVTTTEMKTGYGLDTQSELRMLEAMQLLVRDQPVSVCPTLLAAHAVPPEFDGDSAGYVDSICAELLPEVAARKLAMACDIFVEGGAFTVADGRKLLTRARDLGLAVRVHAEQLSHQGGAQLACEMGALSAGHLEHVTDNDITDLAKAGVVCEVLALAQVYLKGQRPIRGRALVDAGCTVAVGTDANPGTAMSVDLPLAAGLAVTQSGLTVEEALLGITRNAAKALGLMDRGELAVGKRADLVVLDAERPEELVYRWGEILARDVVIAGKIAVRGGVAT